MGILVVATLNQLFITGFHSEIKFAKKNKVVSGKTLIFVISVFCTPHFIYLSITF